jgi:hypothetical protein
MIGILLFLSVTTSPAESKSEFAPEVRSIIERGIAAQGGEKQLERLSKSWRAKIRGKRGKHEVSGEVVNSAPHKSRLTTSINGWIPFDIVVVDNGEHAWSRIAGITRETIGKDLEEMRDGEYRHHVQNLLPLIREPGFKATLLPETTVANQRASGMRIQSQGHRDIDLYFDNKTGLLMKTQSKLLPAGKPPIVLEKILSDYRDFDGLKLATKFTKFENHKLTSVEEYVDIKFVDHIEDREFDKP